ncbi:deoxyribodipyrimidine photo-lyase type I [Formivibrio citricus]|uniref:Deoxyribodipyrimidine photo-lyase n=1 Tax=Formivibrio citricus TaxID=83765 RepID=A0A1I5ACK8_9NEIS|nr:deoxyribodipyrimidine photo-lyase [Formivibrio citricus]SFN60225.1 deoxyribodipyrimidine photo-lyase type I [Formivibrio citricus]
MTTALVWLRRDLRLSDHAALSVALQEHGRVIPVFVFDRTILDPLPPTDRRVAFILESLKEIQARLREYGSGLVVRIGDPRTEIPGLAHEFQASAVYANRDYEPAAIARDTAIAQSLAGQGIQWVDVKDQVIFERDEILSRQGTPFQVFTPYWRSWLQKLTPVAMAEYPVTPYCRNLARLPAVPLPSLEELGFAPNDETPFTLTVGESGAATLLADFARRIEHYHVLRDYPARKGPSYLSTHLRFGTVSIRQLVRLALANPGEGAECWLKELCWREFYQQLLWHRPDLVEHTFRPEFDRLPFPNREDWFAAWCAGRTGYPLVDAGMRQLNQTGWMHNRLRMITASFLVKDLLIDWRRGERYFAEKLLDFDLASNNGGWQWAASVGCDAQPWFRIFNPVTQSRKFDPAGHFIRRYCPELARLPDSAIHAPWLAAPLELESAGIRQGQDYPHPLVDHASQRQAALALFKAASGR